MKIKQTSVMMLAILMIFAMVTCAFSEGIVEGEDVATPIEAPVMPQLLHFSTEEDQKQVYIFVFDAGYALYGSAFGQTIVNEAGDPDGEIIRFVKQASRILVDEKNIVIPVGFHSDAILVDEKPVSDSLQPVSAAQMKKREFSDLLFDAILGIPEGERKSSVFFSTNVTVDKILGIVNSKCYDYDVNVVYVHGGVIQKVSGIEITEEENANIREALAEIREKARVYSLGLDWTDTKYIKDNDLYFRNRVNQFFNVEEIVTVPVEIALSGEVDRVETMNSMIKEVIRILRGEQAAFTEIVPTRDKNDVIKALALFDPNDPVVYVCTGENGKEYFVKTVWEVQNEIEQLEFSSDDALWVCSAVEIENMINFDQERLFASAVEQIKEKTKSGIDKREGKIEIELPLELKIENDMFVAEGEYVTSEINGNKIILTAAKNGMGKITCKFEDYTESIDIMAIDSDINWGWNHEKEFRIIKSADEADQIVYTDGEESINSFDALAEADEFSWRIDEIIGENAEAFAEGEFGSDQECTIDGIEWNASGAEDNSKKVQIKIHRPGVFQITCTSKNFGHEAHVESQMIKVRMPLDPVEDIKLVTPYFKNIPEQLVSFTSGGVPVSDEYYDITVSGENTIAKYFTEDGMGMYIVAEKTGSSEIEIREKYAENPESTVIRVEVESLMSNMMLWIYGAGAFIGLIGLTVATTVIIGKSKRSK